MTEQVKQDETAETVVKCGYLLAAVGCVFGLLAPAYLPHDMAFGLTQVLAFIAFPLSATVGYYRKPLHSVAILVLLTVPMMLVLIQRVMIAFGA